MNDDSRQLGNYVPLSRLRSHNDPQIEEIEGLPIHCEYEMDKDRISVDFQIQIGSGANGLVFKGYIVKNGKGGESPIPVAVKVVARNATVERLAALMSEARILAYIGQHDKIVNLVGVYSQNIRNRELVVAVELCKVALLEFLQNNRQTFEKYLGQAGTSLQSVQSQGSSSNPYANLVRCAADIACGMEFLSNSHVVHGDLAARNILLTFDWHAKIGDFGLARQVTDYTYIKQDVPLPWKWMAIESLTEHRFSRMSDVWAYGVTVWELFSLGEMPYADRLQWSPEFVHELKSGLRLTKPTWAGDDIFSVMLDCWVENATERPTFSGLVQFFQARERDRQIFYLQQ